MVDPDELASSAHVIHVLKIILTGGAWPGGRSKIKEGTTILSRSISRMLLRVPDQISVGSLTERFRASFASIAEHRRASAEHRGCSASIAASIAGPFGEASRGV